MRVGRSLLSSRGLPGVIAAAILATGVLPAAAQDLPSPEAPVVADTVSIEISMQNRQDLVDEVADLVRAAVPSDEFAGLEVFREALSLTVWTTDPAAVRLPDPLGGVAVSVRPARFSRHTLLAAGEAAILALGSGLPRVFAASMHQDGSGTTLFVDGARSRDQGMEAAFTRSLGVAVYVEPGHRIEGMSRQDDSSPWYGGGAMRRGTEYCSTGFPVQTTGGYGRLLSAAHCDWSGNAAWNDGSGDPLTTGGTAVAIKPDRDSLLIDPIGGTNGLVHGGPWNATSSNLRYHLKVATSANNNVGDTVCVSGANSGEHCNVKVTNDAAQWSIAASPYTFVYTGSLAESTDGLAAVAPGDSGGPVYSTRSDGRVTARGIVSASGGRSIPCSSLAYGTTGCTTGVLYYPIQPLITAWGVILETTT